MGRKADLKKVDWIARKAGIYDDELRDEFGDYIHSCKRAGDYGTGSNGDFTDKELEAKLQEFLDMKGQASAGDEA